MLVVIVAEMRDNNTTVNTVNESTEVQTLGVIRIQL